MFLENKILQKLQEVYPDRWEKVIEYFKKKETAFKKAPKNIQEKMGKNYIRNLILDRIKGKEELLKWEQEVLNKIIPKNKLKDGITYIAMEGTENLCRDVEEARWDEEEGMFWYTRNKMGLIFEDTMHHFADVIDERIAGFTPIENKL